VGLKLIVTSVKDKASLKMKEALLKLVDFKDSGDKFDEHPILVADELALVTIKEELIYADHVDGLLGADLAIFASRHESTSKLPSLLVHVPGNWTSRADAGGRPRTLCRAKASSLKEALIELERMRRELGLEGWLCGVEATHHGPFLERTPALFVEVGSSEAEWLNEKAAEAAARAIIKAASSNSRYKSLIGLGGPHYAPKFTKLLLETPWAVSYIAPKYVLEELDAELIMQAVVKSEEVIEGAVLDWKGIRGDLRPKLLEELRKLNIKAWRDEELLR